jgi:hypothetical protein
MILVNQKENQKSTENFLPYTKIWNGIFDLNISHYEKSTLIYLCTYQNCEKIYPSLKKISTKLGISHDTAQRAIQGLIDKNLVLVTKKIGCSNHYFINFDALDRIIRCGSLRLISDDDHTLTASTTTRSQRLPTTRSQRVYNKEYITKNDNGDRARARGDDQKPSPKQIEEKKTIESIREKNEDFGKTVIDKLKCRIDDYRFISWDFPKDVGRTMNEWSELIKYMEQNNIRYHQNFISQKDKFIAVFTNLFKNKESEEIEKIERKKEFEEKSEDEKTKTMLAASKFFSSFKQQR